MLLLDTSAWVALFEGEDEGKEVLLHMREEECCTSLATFAEITDWAIRNKRDYKDRIKRMKALSQIIEITEEIVILAGKINPERKKQVHNWGMMDALIYATAQTYGFTVLTKDPHFDSLPGVKLLGKTSKN